MEQIIIKPFHIIGISVRTSNQNGQAAKDIGALWSSFMSDGIFDNIPNKADNTIYSLYTDYEGDHTKPYTAIIGCKVTHLDVIPEYMIGKSFDGGSYLKFISQGDVTKGAVYETWLKIWNMDLRRLYTVDFEIYGEKAKHPKNPEVAIFIAVS